MLAGYLSQKNYLEWWMSAHLQILPGGADLLLNMASVLHDETIFEDPLTFKPQRYLEGNVKLKKQQTIPFGLGTL